jgi:ADP-ribose pyrophosphatase YjhB (NUDIX family)
MSQRPRPLALCVVWRGREILVFEGRDPVNGQTFYRPLGGGVEWRELSGAAVTREMREELGTDLEDVRKLGVLENVFSYAGRDLHEVVFVFEGRLTDRTLYERDRFQVVEAGGDPVTALWVGIERFGDGGATLYPEGLLELLDRRIRGSETVGPPA